MSAVKNFNRKEKNETDPNGDYVCPRLNGLCGEREIVALYTSLLNYS